MNVISNSIYAIRVRTPIIFIFCYLIFYLINLIRLKKSFKDIEKYEKRLEILKKKKKIIVFKKKNNNNFIPIFNNNTKKNF